MSTRLTGLTLTIVAAAALSACSTAPKGPDYQVPPGSAVMKPRASGAFLEQQRAADAAGQAAAAPFDATPLPPRWWHLFQDPALDALVEQALARNTDLRQAVANLERVQALESEVRGGDKPSISVNGGPSYGHPSGLSMLRKEYVPPDTYRYSAGVGLSYQLDLFGQIRRAIESSQASTEAAAAALDLVKVNVAAGTARAYAEAILLRYSIDQLRSTQLFAIPDLSSTIEPRFIYNQEFRSIYAMAPGVLMLCMILIPAMLTALGVVREKEIGSITNLYASPASLGAFLVGKQMPYALLAMISFVTLILVTVFILGVPLKGSLPALLIGGFLFILSVTGLGLMKTHVDLSASSLLSADHNSLAWDTGGGLIVNVAPHVAVRGDVRYFHAFSDLTVGPLALQNVKLDFGRAAGGLVFSF